MSTAPERKRDLRIDYIRLSALLFVCATHFFLKSGYTSVPVEGPRMAVMTIAKSFFLICVTLFVTITGYLMCEKKLSARYFKGLVKIIVGYVAASAFYAVFARLFLEEQITLAQFFRRLLKYKGSPYGWYVEM